MKIDLQNLKTKNEDFGSVYFRNIDKTNSKAELGIFIGEKKYIGKGYGTLIARQALNYAFTEMKINKVYARVLKYNKPSYYMFKKFSSIIKIYIYI